MLDFLFHSTIAWIGMGGVAVIVCVAVAWLFPPFRIWAIEIGGGILAATAIYAKGASDEKRRQQALQKAAEDAAVASGKTDRAAAERDAANSVRDGFDADDK